jgi:DNA polymerase-3 subunit gamma/tau
VQQFIVSARKYRPMSFDDVVGQKHVAETLMHEIKNNKLAQAFLFTGPRGVGKTTCARILAKVINTTDEVNENHDFAFNVFELDAASNNSVDDIRHLMDQVRIPPQVGKYKVYIIDEVHMLSTAAFNAFLKTLEEPPSYAIFILATTERHKILPTILSRCQVFNFNRILVTDMVKHLVGIADKEGIKVSEDALHLIARKADGGLRDALSMFDQLVSFSGGEITYEKAVEMLSILDMDTYFSLADNMLNNDSASALLTINTVLNQGFDASLITSGMSQHFRNLIVSLDPMTNSLLDVSESFKEKYKDQSRKFDIHFLLNALNISNEADEKYRISRNHRLLIELMILKLVNLRSFMKDIPNLNDLKKKLADTSATPSTKLPQTASFKTAPSIKEDVAKKVESTRMGILSREAFKQKKQSSVENSQDSIEELPILLEADSKPIEQLDTGKIIAEIVKKQGPRIAGLLNSIKTELHDETLKFIVSSKMHIHTIEEIRLELLRELNQLSNGRIKHILVEMGEVEAVSRKPYTDKEKLEFLMSKHPLLQEAIEKLQLRLP